MKKLSKKPQARRKTRYPSVYERIVKARHKGRPDKVIEYCYNLNGRKVWRIAGRASAGCTAKAASDMRAEEIAGRGGKSPETLTVAGAAGIYLDSLRARGTKVAPFKSKFRNWIYPTLENVRIADITPAMLQETHDALAARLAGSSVRGAFKVLSASIGHAVRFRHYAGINPVSRAAGFTVTAREVPCERYLTEDEAERLLEELGRFAPEWRDMAFLSLHTGIRLTELMRMTPSDLCPDGLTAVISGKTGGRDPLLLTPEAAEILRRRSIGKGPGEPVFGYRRNYAFARAVARLGFNEGLGRDRRNRVWFHTLRHTFASWLIQRDTDIYTVQKLMRHRSIAMTQRYAHLGEDRCRAALESIRTRTKTRS
jgi:integrase